jgi:hypothetical protein
MRPLLSRLHFLDKMCYDRAYACFRLATNVSTTNEEETSFLLSLLDSGRHFEDSTVHNAINFARSWAELGWYPANSVLSRILCLCFLSDRFVNQLVCLSEIVPVRGWVFHAISKLTHQDHQHLVESIQKDATVWAFLCDVLFEDAKSKPINYDKQYCEREDHCSFLIEALPLAWPYEQKGYIKYETLIGAVSQFCVSCRSTTAIKLLDCLCWAFPRAAATAALEVLDQLSCDVIGLLLRLGLIPAELQVGKFFALKVLAFDKRLALAIIEKEPDDEGKKNVLQIISRFDPERQQVTFD